MMVYWLTDGKDGHRRQAEGLFAGLTRLGVAVQVQAIPVQRGLRDGWSMQQSLPPEQVPDLLLGVGHQTHLLLLWLKHQYPTAQTLLLMRPSLPLRWFDGLVMPRHDHPVQSARILSTQGVLNPFTNQQRHQAGLHLILIGGASKRHDWNQAQLLAQLAALAQHLQGQSVCLSGSRRTPADFFADSQFQQISAQMQVHTMQQTGQDWLCEQLQRAETVWLTEDSVSMLYEAWTAGCQIGLLRMPRRTQDRVTRVLDQLIEQHVVLPVADYLAGQALCVPPALAEADRAAAWLLGRLPHIERIENDESSSA